MGSLTTEDGRPVDNATDLHILMQDPIGNDDDILKLLQRNPDVKAQNIFNQTALMLGIAHGLIEKEIIQPILDDTDFSLTDKSGKSLLHYFCFHGVKTCISIPLEKCGILAKTNDGEVALHHVYDVDILKKLLDCYANKDLLSPEKWPYPSTKSELMSNLEDFSKNPSQLLHKKGVIELLCSPSSRYPIPKDISKVILFALKKCEESPEMCGLLKCILEFGAEAIDADHIREAIQLDNVELFHQVVNYCRAIKSIVSSSDVLLKCLQKAKKNGDMFYSTLRGHLDDSKKLIEIRDNLGNNVVHVMCKYEKLDQLQDLLTEEQIAAKLFSSVNKENCFPLALLKEPKGEFLEIFKSYFITPPKGFKKITLATPTSDLLHFAIKKKRSHKLAINLLKADFPVNNDGNGLSPLHKAVRYLKYNAVLQEEILLRQSESDDIPYINHKDNFGFSAFDYAIVYEKKEYFQFFRNRNAFYDQLQAEKMVQYLVFEKERSAENIDYILEDLGITYPDTKNEAYVREIKTALKKAEETKSSTDMAAATQAKKTTILNILIVHSETIPFNLQLACKYSDDSTIVLCHSLPLESFSLDHLHHFKGLHNRRLFFVGDKEDPALSKLLTKLLGVDKTAFATSMDDVPAKLFHRSGREEESSLLPSPELLNKDEEISEVVEDNKVELEAHRGESGYFFVSDTNTHYSKSFYNILSETSGIGKQDALAGFGLFDAYFTETGETTFHQQMKSRPSITPATSNKNTIDLKVTFNELNISRFATPMICSELITRYMLIPENDRMKLISPDVFLSFEVNTEGDFLRVRAEVGQNMSSEVLLYTLGLLRKVGITLCKSKYVGLDILWDYRGQFVSITGEDLPTQDSLETKNVDYDIEAAEIRFDPSETTTITGSSLLLSCDVNSLETAIIRIAPHALVQTYYVKRLSLNPECAMLQDNPGTRQPSRLLYRLFLIKKGYTIRQFVGDGEWTDKQRQAICTAIGVPVGETYTKLENCWRLNWADVLVLFIGATIVVAILVVCEVTGFDLETYGVAGIATLPFILALLNRVRLSYSNNPGYSKLPSLNPE